MTATDTTISPRTIAIYQMPEGRSSAGAVETTCLHSVRRGATDEAGAPQPLWRRAPLPAALDSKLGEPLRSYFASSVRRYVLDDKLGQEIGEAQWFEPVQGPDDGSFLSRLPTVDGKPALTFSMHDLEAWALPWGIIAITAGFDPSFPIDGQDVGPVGECLAALGTDSGRATRQFRDPSQREGVEARLGSSASGGLFTGLSGGRVRIRRTLDSVAPPGALRCDALRPFVYLHSPAPLTRHDHDRLARMARAVNRNDPVTPVQIDPALHSDGPKRVTFGIRREGAVCWAQADQPLVTGGDLERRFVQVYLPLYLLSLAQATALSSLARRIETATYTGQPVELSEVERDLVATSLQPEPSATDHHHEFFAQVRRLMGIDELVTTVRGSGSGGGSVSIGSPAPAPQQELFSSLEQVLDSTRGWFCGSSKSRAYECSCLPHDPPQEEDLEHHRERVLRAFPWMPATWWSCAEGAGALHSALKTVVGKTSGLVAQRGARPLSVPGAYLVMCHAAWQHLGDEEQDMTIMDPLLTVDWRTVTQPYAPFLPLQQQHDTLTAVALLQRVTVELLCAAAGPEVFGATAARFLPQFDGGVLEIDLSDRVDCVHLTERIQHDVRASLSAGVVHDLGATAAALIRLNMALVPGFGSCGAGGGVTIEGGRLRLYAALDLS